MYFPYRAFLLTWLASIQIYWGKRKCVRKEFNSHRIGLGHQQARRFIVLGTMKQRATPFLCKRFPFFQKICINAAILSENAF